MSVADAVPEPVCEPASRRRRMMRHKLKQIALDDYIKLFDPCWGVVRPLGPYSLVPDPKLKKRFGEGS